MNAVPKISWKIDLTTSELKLIRKSLEHFGGNGIELANKINERLQNVRKEFVAAIDASLTLEKNGNET